MIVNRIKPIQQSDAELILLWQQGDEMAFSVIYKRYALKILAIAIDKTRDRDLAEELVQDTFITLYKSKVSADKLTSLTAYLYIILKNKIMDNHRRNFIQRKYNEYFIQQYTEIDDSTRALIETRELEQLLYEEIQKLPIKCRAVFDLKRQDHMTNKQIAIRLEISENTVEQHVRRALRLLRISFMKQELLIITFMIAEIFNHIKCFG